MNNTEQRIAFLSSYDVKIEFSAAIIKRIPAFDAPIVGYNLWPFSEVNETEATVEIEAVHVLMLGHEVQDWEMLSEPV